MFDELAERSLMSPLAGTKHTYVRLAIIIYCQKRNKQQKNEQPYEQMQTTAQPNKREAKCVENNRAMKRLLKIKTY